MSAVTPVPGQTQPVDAPQEVSQTAVTQAATDTTRIVIATVADLKTASPALYKAIIMGIATRLKHQEDASQLRIKEILAEARRN